MTGKAYANRKTDRPEGDFYPTPRSLVWAAAHLIDAEFPLDETILEPCSGDGAISDELKHLKYNVRTNDLFRDGVDYLTTPFHEKYVITNPPFSLWDEFVCKAKLECDKLLIIGRLNYFGTAARLKTGMWDNLKSVHCFNRYVDYRTDARDDGMFNVGAMATAWFLWDMSHTQDPTIHFLDIQRYAKLGNYNAQKTSPN